MAEVTKEQLVAIADELQKVATFALVGRRLDQIDPALVRRAIALAEEFSTLGTQAAEEAHPNNVRCVLCDSFVGTWFEVRQRILDMGFSAGVANQGGVVACEECQKTPGWIGRAVRAYDERNPSDDRLKGDAPEDHGPAQGRSE